MTERRDPFARAEVDAAVVRRSTGGDGHDIAVVLGSGWGPVADQLGEPEAIVETANLRGFGEPTVPGHGGRIRSTPVGDHRLLVFEGRVHGYEGHSADTVVHGVRVAVLAGCETLVLTNAAGSLRPEWPPGQVVLVTDHINLMGRSPLTGPPTPEGYPSRFVDLTDAYSPRLRDLARTVDPELPEGVYAGVGGPNFETPAEIRMLNAAGADLVGMSTVLETIAARHLGAEVLALSLVTNLAAGLTDRPIGEDEVFATASAAAERLGTLLRAILEQV